MRPKRLLALLLLAAAAVGFYASQASAYHVLSLQPQYAGYWWARPAPASDAMVAGSGYYGPWKNLVFFTQVNDVQSYGYDTGGPNGRVYQVKTNTVNYVGAGSNVVPGSVYPDYNVVAYEAASPAQGNTQGDVTVVHNYYGPGGSPPCFGGPGTVGCAVPGYVSDSFGTHLKTVQVVLNDTTVEQFQFSLEKRRALLLHEFGHAVANLDHVELDTDPAARTQCSVMRSSIGATCHEYTYPWHIGGAESDWGSAYVNYNFFHPPSSGPPSATGGPAASAPGAPILSAQDFATRERQRADLRAFGERVRAAQGKPFAALDRTYTAAQRAAVRKGMSDYTYNQWARGEFVLGQPVTFEAVDPLLSRFAGVGEHQD